MTVTMTSQMSPQIDARTATISRILVPLDGSPLAECALPPAIALARACHAELVLLRVSSSIGSLPSGSSGWCLARHKTPEPSHAVNLYLARQEEATRLQGVRVEGRVLYQPPIDAIIEVAAHGPADLIVLATHGPRGADGGVSAPSVAATVVRHAKTPVLLLTAATKNPFDPQARTGPRIQLDTETVAQSDHAVPYAQLLARAFNGQLVGIEARRSDLLVQAPFADRDDAKAAAEEVLRTLHEVRVPLLLIP